MSHCRFCGIVRGAYNHPMVDRPFAENSDFIAVASIGALVEGWSLVVPKTHQTSMRDCYANPLLIEMADLVIPRVVDRYGPAVVFEHGANRDGSLTSCGTDHAHLHILPLAETLLPDMMASGLAWIRCTPQEIAAISDGKEYLFYADLPGHSWGNPKGHAHVLEKPTSQFFRRLIARRIGEGEAADYKIFPRVEASLHTRRALAVEVAHSD